MSVGVDVKNIDNIKTLNTYFWKLQESQNVENIIQEINKKFSWLLNILLVIFLMQ